MFDHNFDQNYTRKKYILFSFSIFYSSPNDMETITQQYNIKFLHKLQAYYHI